MKIILIFSEASSNGQVIPSSWLAALKLAPECQGPLSGGIPGRTLALKQRWALECQVGERLVTLALEWHILLTAQETAEPGAFVLLLSQSFHFQEVTSGQDR